MEIVIPQLKPNPSSGWPVCSTTDPSIYDLGKPYSLEAKEKRVQIIYKTSDLMFVKKIQVAKALLRKKVILCKSTLFNKRMPGKLLRVCLAMELLPQFRLSIVLSKYLAIKLTKNKCVDFFQF